MKRGKNVAYHVFRTIVDMMKPKAEIVWDALASVGDAGAHKICVMTQENGKPIDLTGCTAQLLVQRQDEATRYLNADFDSGGYACATLDKSCYEVAGRLQCTMQIKGENQSVISVARIYLLVSKAGGDIVIDPTHVVPNLNELLAQYERLKEISDQTEKTILKANTATKNADAATQKADGAAKNAEDKAEKAGKAATNAQAAADRIDGMTATAASLSADETPTANLVKAGDHYELELGIPQGRKGDTGATPKIKLSVVTGEPGTDARVEQSGTAENPMVEFTIPRGDTGDIGNLTINGKAPDGNGAVTLKPEDLGAASAESVSSLKSEIAAQESSIGDAWTSGKTYTVGDYCISRNQLYKCKTAHTAGSTFNLGYWITSNVCAEIKANNDTYTIDASKFFADNSKIDTASILKCGNVVRLTIKFNSISFSEDDVLAKINPEYAPKAVTYTTGFIYGLDTAIDITLTSWGDIKVFGMHTIESKKLYMAVTYII